MPDALPTDIPLERYLRVMETLAPHPDGLSLSELVGIMGLPKTTVHRLLGTLARTRAIRPSPRRPGAHVLAPRMLGLLYAAAPDDWLEALARPILTELADQTGLSCFLARLSERTVRSVASIAPETATIHAFVKPGQAFWPHAAATGKAILAFQPGEARARILPRPLPRLTDRTNTDPAILAAELEAVRAQGVAFCRGEDVPGLGGIACPIHVPGHGVAHAVALGSTVEVLFDDDIEQRIARLRLGARRLGNAISARLSVRGDARPMPLEA
ncbi:IclR family transcriptional regulator [Zavarzinia sp. CC-PAN008]|uniref:IclR family transcriptional regulator n=1 Tax=Zavarzinia sp. CC-PAN008 TaxID=3243332 RepID=UPI003F742BF9